MPAEMIRARDLTRGDLVECPRSSSSIGPHVARVTHANPVGTHALRVVVSLDCGHDVNMTDAHGLYRVKED